MARKFSFNNSIALKFGILGLMVLTYTVIEFLSTFDNILTDLFISFIFDAQMKEKSFYRFLFKYFSKFKSVILQEQFLYF